MAEKTANTEMDEEDDDEGDFLSSYSNLLLPNSAANAPSSGFPCVVPIGDGQKLTRLVPLPPGFDLWFCSIVDVPCTQSAEWNIFLSFVSDDERIKITRFRFDDDRKRALVSILLQKAFIRHRLDQGVGLRTDGGSYDDNDDDAFSIRRTQEGKPYAFLKEKSGSSLGGHWNYNLSHHGQFVAIVSHPKFLIGIDLVDISTRSPSIRSAQAYVEMFDRNLDQKELAFILG